MGFNFCYFVVVFRRCCCFLVRHIPVNKNVLSASLNKIFPSYYLIVFFVCLGFVCVCVCVCARARAHVCVFSFVLFLFLM